MDAPEEAFALEAEFLAIVLVAAAVDDDGAAGGKAGIVAVGVSVVGMVGGVPCGVVIAHYP
jgi:hypothetical protein